MATAECHARGVGCTIVGSTLLHVLYVVAVESGAGKDAEASKDVFGEENDENEAGENVEAVERVVRLAAVSPTVRSSRRLPCRTPRKFVIATSVDSAK